MTSSERQLDWTYWLIGRGNLEGHYSCNGRRQPVADFDHRTRAIISIAECRRHRPPGMQAFGAFAPWTIWLQAAEMWQRACA